MVSLDAMMVFVTVAETHSFTKAAEHLALSKARVSQIVSELEQQLKTRLLNRSTRALSLTDAGELYFEKCQLIQALALDANQQVQDTRLQLSGLIRIAAPVGSQPLIQALAAFMQLHPHITIQLIESDAYSNLIDDRFDIAIRTRPESLPNTPLYAAPLGTFQVILCATPRYLANFPPLQNLADLQTLAWLCHSIVYKDKQLKITDINGKEHYIPTTPKIIANTALALKSFLLNDMGFSLLPTYIIEEELKQGSLIPILPELYTIQVPYYAVYANRQLMPLRIRLLIDFLKSSNVFATDFPLK
jgi:DNA-binding transcriptional LysR family regulator